MGKTEKIVVLSVLFAIVVLFVWSLDQGEPKAAGPAGTTGGLVQPRAQGGAGQAPDPTKGVAAPVAPLSGRGTPASVDPDAKRQPEVSPVVQPRPHAGDVAHPSAGPLLVAGVNGDDVPASSGPGVVLQPDWDLVTLAGLEATVDPEVFATVSRAGDTWETLAERLYGDPTKARVLRRSNEGTALAVGTALLVPAVDRLPKTPEVREVEVLEGEGLWHVAKRALGSGARWRELYEANQDRIADPDQVKAGTLLRVP